MSTDPATPSAAAIAAAFGIGGRVGALVPVDGAWSNRVFRLDVGGDAYAVKQLLNPWRIDGWFDRIDEAWRLEQAALDAGIRMPEPVPEPSTGGWRAEVEQTDGAGTVTVRLHRWVDGQPAPTGPASEELARWCGRTLAALHGLGLQPARPEVFPAPDTATSLERWSELVERLGQARHRLVDQARRATTAIEEIHRLHGARSPGPTVMGHRDIDQKNLLLAGAPVLCDWDVAGPEEPGAELADVALSMARWQRPAVARATIDAYRATGGPAGPPRPEDLVPMLVSGLHWVTLNLERAAGLTGSDRERQLGEKLAPDLLASLGTKVEIARHIDRFLESR